MKASLVIPATSVENERFFSKLKYVKTLLANKMSVRNTFARLKVLLAKIPEKDFDFTVAM